MGVASEPTKIAGGAEPRQRTHPARQIGEEGIDQAAELDLADQLPQAIEPADIDSGDVDSGDVDRQVRPTLRSQPRQRSQIARTSSGSFTGS
ncbi:MAG: hypothetical protein WDO24_05880 [Pseudomonadota bacterium]